MLEKITLLLNQSSLFYPNVWPEPYQVALITIQPAALAKLYASVLKHARLKQSLLTNDHDKYLSFAFSLLDIETDEIKPLIANTDKTLTPWEREIQVEHYVADIYLNEVKIILKHGWQQYLRTVNNRRISLQEVIVIDETESASLVVPGAGLEPAR